MQPFSGVFLEWTENTLAAILGTMSEEQPKRRGRPPGTGAPRYTESRSYKLGPEDLENIRRLADAWRCSEAAAVRRAIAEAVRREGA